MSTPTETAPKKANDDVLLRLLAVGQRWKARGEGAEYCSIISLDAGTDYPVQFQWERDKILGRDTAAGFLDNNEPAEASASEFIRVALATLQAENAELRTKLVESDRTLDTAIAEVDAARAEAASLRERLEAAASIKAQLQWWRDWATGLVGDGLPESQQGALTSLIEERERVATRALARATAAEGERDDCKFQLESVIAARPHWEEFDRKLTNVAGDLEGTALAIAEARLRGAEAERDEWEGRWLERGDDLKLAEGERDRLREALKRIRETVASGDRCYSCGAYVEHHTKCSIGIAIAALAVIPHTEGEASAPPKAEEQKS